jgi:hypothetical protein
MLMPRRDETVLRYYADIIAIDFLDIAIIDTLLMPFIIIAIDARLALASIIDAIISLIID